MLTKVKEAGKRLTTGGILCMLAGFVQAAAIQLLGLKLLFPTYDVGQVFALLVCIGTLSVGLGLIILLFVWLINVADKL